jgi:U3 small nucleolar RNA-associated protein 15
LATEEMIWSSKDLHADYVRTVDSSPISSEIFVSGCYDHSVRLWDSRQQQPIQTMVHDHPVECCMFTPSGAMLLTASGNEMKVWDLLGGGRLLHTFSNHQKNITSLCMDGSGTRVLSAGLDGHVKVHSLQTMQVSHGMKFGQPLSAVGMSPDNKKLVVGFFSGNLMVRTRRTPDSKSAIGGGPNASSFGSIETDGELSRLQTMSRHYRGAGKAPVKMEDWAVESERTVRLQSYEKFFQKFNYQKALDSALKTKNPLIVITVLEELSRRSGLTIALSGRDEETIEFY